MNQRLLKNGENINSQDITLFCFPFAGGGASTYTSWIKKLKDKITVCPIQLPGREERIMEKPYTDLGIQVNHYSSYFLQKGIRKGNKVVIQLNNTKEYVFSILALIQIGAIPVLTNYALRDKEVTGIIERSEAIAYVYSKEILVWMEWR